jgi:hypothetical protein
MCQWLRVTVLARRPLGARTGRPPAATGTCNLWERSESFMIGQGNVRDAREEKSSHIFQQRGVPLSRYLPLLLLVGCTAAENTDCDVSFSPEVHTVLDANWTSPQPGRSWAEYDVDGETVSTPVEDDGSTSHHVDLLGLEALVDVPWTLFTESAEGQRWQCSGTSQTENLLPQSVNLEVLSYLPELVDPTRYVMVTAYSLAPNPWVFVADRETGATRWYLAGDQGTQITTARPNVVDGNRALSNGVIYNQADSARLTDVGQILSVDAAGAPVSQVRTPWAHHVFTVLPDGTITWLALDGRPWYDPDTHTTQMVAGDSIHELSPDGTDREIFSVWDWAEIAPNALWEQSFYPGYIDWTHADGIRWNEEKQVYIVTFAGLEQVWIIGRDGVPQIRLGPDADYVPTPEVNWARPHDASILPDGSMLVYLGVPERRRSGCHQLQIDEATHTLIQKWVYTAEIGGFALGKCTRMDNGNTTVGFGDGGRIQEVTPEGQVVWDARSNQPAGFGTAFPFDDLYPPEP